MSLPVLFFSAFIVALSGALMPGPLLTVTVAHSPRFGWTFGPLAILGHGILELGLISVVFVGAGPVLRSTAVQSAVGMVGGGILLWMGLGMAASAGAADRDRSEASPPVRKGRAVWLGLLMSLSNPYWTLWWATVGLAFMSTAQRTGGATGVAVFFAGHISGDLAWYTLVSTGAAAGRNLVGTKPYGVLLMVCAAALMVLGGWFILYGFRLL